MLRFLQVKVRDDHRSGIKIIEKIKSDDTQETQNAQSRKKEDDGKGLVLRTGDP